MKVFVIFLFAAAGSLCLAHGPDHKLWDDLLRKHVSDRGVVQYQGFIADSLVLNRYLRALEQQPPQPSWTREAVLAYWINAYNAYTVQLVIRHYPLKSIKDIAGKIPFVNTSWDIKFIHIGGEKLDLNNIEHGKIRKKFDDPRVHMALVCASRSCPILLNEAYTADKLESQLEKQSRAFLADTFRNKISKNQAQLSMIFKWYAGDFNTVGGVRAFVNKYGPTRLEDGAKITHLDYDWGLNDR